MIDNAVTDLPDPDSPTIPVVIPFSEEKLILSTALMTPESVVNSTDKFLTLIRELAAI
jgi:hypothetical protein